MAGGAAFKGVFTRRDVIIPELVVSPQTDITVSQGSLVSWSCGANVTLTKAPVMYWTVGRTVVPGNYSVTTVGVASYRVDNVLDLVTGMEHSGARVSCVLVLVDDVNNTLTTHTDYQGRLTVTDHNANTRQLRSSEDDQPLSGCYRSMSQL